MFCQPRHDCKVYELWRLKCEDREAALYHASLARKLDRQKQCRQAAQSMMDKTHQNWCFGIQILEKPESVFKDVNKIRASIAKNHRVPVNDIPVVLFANWSAPSLLKAESQRRQASSIGAIVNDSTAGLNFGIVLVPAVSAKKGLLWQEESKCRELLANCNVNCDSSFVMAYTCRNDLRETRTINIH